MKETTPYTYLIGWSKMKKYYYGVRWADGCTPRDLWVTYFTSSKYVAWMREFYGEPDIIEIRKTGFANQEAARDYEFGVLSRLNSCDPFFRSASKWLNLRYAKGFSCKGMKFPRSAAVRENLSKQRKGKRTGVNNPWYGKKHTEEYKRLASIRMTGRGHHMFGKHRSEETKRKIGDGNRGKIISAITRKKISESHTRELPIKCPHCQIEGGPRIMKRWHFDRCKTIAKT